ncbi:hypothetical protein [Bdellovibrio bacteriovorus]|uniref:hypothetical protein n=1 Tax=Bdellovibrio bacteriovorus TaxID=959 RepID=UPI0035A5BD66
MKAVNVFFKFSLVFGLLVSAATAQAFEYNYTIKGDYEVGGSCEKQTWIQETPQHGHWEIEKISSPNDPGNLSYVTLGGHYFRILRDGKCSLFQAMLDCPSQKGSFEIHDMNGPIYDKAATVESFKCLKR